MSEFNIRERAERVEVLLDETLGDLVRGGLGGDSDFLDRCTYAFNMARELLRAIRGNELLKWDGNLSGGRWVPKSLYDALKDENTLLKQQVDLLKVMNREGLRALAREVIP